MDADIFLQQFGHLAQGEGGIKKLRDAILQLAVRGKLVEQNPADEPAEVLLKKIAVARKNFTSDYKLNTSKENQPVSASQIPHALPNSWQWVRLSNISIIVGGGTPSSSNPEYFCDDGIAWLTPADMYALKSKFVSHGRRDLTSAGLSNSSAQLMPKGSVLFSSRAPIGYVAIAANEVATNQGFKSCVPFIGDMSEYIYCYLKSAVPYIESLASGTTFKEVSGKVVANVLFPLPPLTEQKRIAAKVDELMALCDKLEAQQKAQRTLKTQAVQSTLHHFTSAESPASFGTSLNILEHAFGNWFDDLATVKHLRATILQLAVQGKLVPQNSTDEPASALVKKIEKKRKELVAAKLLRQPTETSNSIDRKQELTIPESWDWSKCDKIFFVTKLAGFEYTKHFNLTPNGEIPVVRAQNVRPWMIEKNNLLYLDAATSDILVRSALTKPCILMTFIGAGIGDASLFDEARRWHLAPNVAKMELFDGCEALLELKYLILFLNSPFGRLEIFKHLKSTAQPSISMGTIRDIDIPIPPIAEQKRIVAKVDELMALCGQLEAHITHTQTLNTHLMDSLIHCMTIAA